MAALRSVRRLQQVVLLPRIGVTSVRAESGGKGSSHPEVSKTLVSFPVKVSHFQHPATGENRSEAPRPVMAPLLDVEGLGGVSDRESQIGQEVSHVRGQKVDGTSHTEDSSSSSSSDSSSDSDSEEDNALVSDAQANKGSNGDGHKRLTDQKSDRMSLEEESPIAPEQKDRIGVRGENTEDLQDSAPVVTTEEQSLHTAPLPRSMTCPDANKTKTHDKMVPSEDSSSTTTSGTEQVKVLSTSEELSSGGGEEKSILTPIQLTTASDEFPIEAVETSAPESSKTQIVLSTISKDLSTNEVEMAAAESRENQVMSTTTSVELPTGEEASELYESHPPQESRTAPPQEPFDNTKYQNLQHFTYTAFTFVDMDVDMAKYRLPQPTSGRPSPRH